MTSPKFTPSQLTDLATHLEAKADLSEALAKDHEMNREATPALRQRKRAQNARFYATVCREAARQLTAKEAKQKRGPFTPPSWGELMAFCSENCAPWPMEDRQKWYDHFNSNGWKVGGRTVMVDWQAAARNGFRNWREKNPQAVPSLNAQVTGDPDGWAAWLKNRGEKYQKYKYVQPQFLKDEFHKEKKQ